MWACTAVRYLLFVVRFFARRAKKRTTQHYFLTAREREILSLMAAGKTNPQIAAQLIIGAGTVKTHTLNIYRKLEVANRTQAIVRAGVEMRLERYTNSESTSGSFGICYTHPLKHVAHEGSRSCNTDAWAAPA
jgi:DNA-binding CsgD family transcriptional regulator